MARLPILMYHNLTLNENESYDLTISAKRFEEQLKYLIEKKYTSIFVSDLINSSNIPNKSIVLTFDDVTENQLIYAVPLLKKYNCKATFFVPFAYIGKSDTWNIGSERIMSIEQLKSLDSNCIELGHHSYNHKKYSELSFEEIQDDFDKSFEVIHKNNLNVIPALAYPYGNFPKEESKKAIFFELLKKNKIEMALRIGNRVNNFPLRNKLLVKRIDIKGHENMLTFQWKIRLGKLRLF